MNNWIEDTLYDNGTLKNKLNIRDPQKLQEVEYLGSAERAVIIVNQKPKISSLKDLRKIHKFMFSFLYDWAGEYRKGNFQKNGYVFFDRSRFEYAEQDINKLIDKNKSILSARDYANLLDKINYMHPFREGNGRSTKIFLQCYAAQHQQVLDYPRENEKMIKAQNDANIEEIAKLLIVEKSPTKEAAYRHLILKEKYKEQARKRAIASRQGLKR